MKKFKNITFGGIQQKIFNLVLIMLVLIMAAYSVMIVYQMKNLTGLVTETNDAQKEAITAISQETMDAVIAQTQSSRTQMQAYIADDLFSDTADTVGTLAEYTHMLFEAPDQYSTREVSLPDAALDGTASVQLLTEAGVDLNDPVVAEKLGLIGNLSELMLSMYGNVEVDSCYVALPEGVMLLADDHASSKFDENGEIVSIPIHERDWYRGAIEKGGLYFTDIASDVFTGQYCIMCAMPVYDASGSVVAVAGADLFLDNMEAYVNASDENGQFTCIVNQYGHVVFSPRSEGIFQIKGVAEAEDLRKLGNAELASFIDRALAANTDVTLVEADGATWYMTGAPIPAVGWTVVSLVDKAVADQPTVMLAAQYDEISQNAVSSFEGGISRARTWITVALMIVTVLALVGALTVSKRIVKPLETMTKRVISLGGDNLQFMMEDTYRTGDEIEALAESFATLSARTLQYVDEVKKVTAEKERIGAELSLATDIQASMLPHIFPAFPMRSEFDIYASMDPAKEVGGDFYDYFLIDDDHLGLVIADVSGKGVPAALFMMASKIILQSVAMLGNSPAEILRRTNEAVCSNNEAQMFVTVWLGILELSTGKLTAANAGHEFPALRQPNEKFELYKDKHGFVIGGMEGVRYKEYEIQLEPGSKLFVYTDGVAEATNAEKELFGTERMIDALNADPNACPEEILKNVREAVDGFVKEAEQFDDLTMLCVEYKGGAKA
ncbi:MAG: SpoIIE family protein phosphatase [Clostridia bacterium]|nr:SpoIIE family protein phosphatase [Clostridia bacterium]